MLTIELECTCMPFSALGPRACALMQTFGLTRESLARRALHHRLSLTLRPGQICFLTGPSGAGKSVLLDAVYDHLSTEPCIRLESIPLEAGIALIDALDVEPEKSLPLLTRAGLADIPSLLHPPAWLSEGQKWRYRLARALLGDYRYVFADEFCALLDDTAAKAVAWHLRRIADRSGRIFFLAGSRTDVLADLAPDIVVEVSPDALQITRPRDRRDDEHLPRVSKSRNARGAKGKIKSGQPLA